MTNQAISIFNQLRPISVGYDDIFDNFQSMFNHQYDSISQPNYPPYNIVKTDKYKYDIQVALAGYSKKDVDVSFENSVLTIKSLKDKGCIYKDITGVYKYNSLVCPKEKLTSIEFEIQND